MNRSQDFARCASSHREECQTCARNENINPVLPESMRQVWMGVWVIEDQRCPSRVPLENKSA